MFAQPFVQAQIKEDIKAPGHWPLWREFTGHRWIPLQRAINAANVSIWCHYGIISHKRRANAWLRHICLWALKQRRFYRESWAPFQYDEYNPRYRDSNHKDKTVVRPSYLYIGNPYIGKTASINQSTPPCTYSTSHNMCTWVCCFEVIMAYRINSSWFYVTIIVYQECVIHYLVSHMFLSFCRDIQSNRSKHKNGSIIVLFSITLSKMTIVCILIQLPM